MYDWLLFLHVLAAFALGATTVLFSAVVLGAPVNARTHLVSTALWNAGGLGTLVFGVWLALYVDGYELWDGWIIAGFVLWALASGAGEQAQRPVAAVLAKTSTLDAALRRRIAGPHWVRTVLVLALFAVMIYKPGA